MRSTPIRRAIVFGVMAMPLSVTSVFAGNWDPRHQEDPAQGAKVPPANLTASIKSDAYKLEIISKGGKLMGRSSSMPAWLNVLSAEQIADVVAYLRTIAVDEQTSRNTAVRRSMPPRPE